MAPIGQQKLCFMASDNIFYLDIHLVDSPNQFFMNFVDLIECIFMFLSILLLISLGLEHLFKLILLFIVTNYHPIIKKQSENIDQLSIFKTESNKQDKQNQINQMGNSLIDIKLIKSMEAEPHKKNVQYLLVLDFEATCVEDKKIQPCPQIIEIPIIVVHLPTGKHLDIFHHYVKPTINTQLSPFCTQLTGITQEMVEPGLQLPQVLEELDKWIIKLNYLKDDNFTMVTCGDWDLRSCLKQEAKQKKLCIRKYLRNYINIKKYFAQVKGNQGSTGMMQMLKALDIEHEGKHHSGIDDVRNICKICIELSQKYGATFPKREINFVKYPMQADNLKPEKRYLLILDFQATCIQNAKLQPCSEIIEFPVTIIDSHEVKQLQSFNRYVLPKFNPKLSQFCTQLTGITQQQVNASQKLQVVLEEFNKWIQSQQYLTKDNFVFVTCGDWDFCTCLRKQAKIKGIKLPEYFTKYINIKGYFPKLINTKAKVRGMTQMLQKLSLKPFGKHHSGKDDVQNITNICLELLNKQKAKFPKSEIRYVEY